MHIAATLVQKYPTLRILYRKSRCFYHWARFTPSFLFRRWRSVRKHRNEWQQELAAVEAICNSGMYTLNEPLSNRLEPFEGRNFLRYPAHGGIERNGAPIGWMWGHSYVELGDGDRIPAYQSLPDLQFNLPLVFAKHRPELVFDFGTANGASAWLYRQLMLQYCSEPIVVSIDIVDVLKGPYGDTHRIHNSCNAIQFAVGDAIGGEVFSLVRDVLASWPDRRVLFSFDDDHSASHVYRELSLYAPLLEPGDVLLVQDTWDQGLHIHMFSPLLAAIRFLQERTDFDQDVDLLRQVELPCNFVHGLLYKKA